MFLATSVAFSRRPSAASHLRLQDLADVDLGDSHVAVRVALDVLEAAESGGSMSSTSPRRSRATPSRRP
jgi:hypothetical protein